MKFITVFKAITKNWLRSRSGLFFSIMFPILLLLVFGAIFSGIGGSTTYKLFVQNSDLASDGQPTEISGAFIAALNSTGTFELREVPITENATDYAHEKLGPNGGNMRILIISEGFQDDLINGTYKIRLGISYNTLNTTYQYYTQYLNDTEKIAVQQGLDQMQQYGADLPEANASITMMLDPTDPAGLMTQNIINSVANSFNYQMMGAANAIVFNMNPISITTFRVIDFYIPGITAAFIMTNGIIGLTSTNTEFKRRGLIKRLSITPLTKMDWIIGCVLSQTLLNIILAMVMIAVGWAVFNVQVIPDAFSIAMIFLGSILFSGIGMTLAGVIKDIEAANAIGNAIAFPMMFLSGTYFPLELMPAYLQPISKVIPLTYFSEGLKATMITKIPETIWLNLAVVGALAAIFIVIGAFVTRWKEK